MTIVKQSHSDFSAIVEELPAIPHDDEGPVFAEPWEAEVFAMALTLHASGFFTWIEWAEQLHTSIQKAQQNGDLDLGDTYYSHWLDALETLIVTKQLGSTDQLASLYTQWDVAAKATAHGQPITLSEINHES